MDWMRSAAIVAVALGLTACAGSSGPCLCSLLGLSPTRAQALPPEPVAPAIETQIIEELPPVEARPPARVVERIVLEGVHFAFDSAQLEPSAQQVLDRAVAALREHPQARLEIAGHTDAVGDDAYNQRLSERRAEAVLRRLVQRGVDAARLRAVGYGESRPLADNATRDGRARNRRVELNVLP